MSFHAHNTTFWILLASYNHVHTLKALTAERRRARNRVETGHYGWLAELLFSKYFEVTCSLRFPNCARTVDCRNGEHCWSIKLLNLLNFWFNLTPSAYSISSWLKRKHINIVAACSLTARPPCQHQWSTKVPFSLKFRFNLVTTGCLTGSRMPLNIKLRKLYLCSSRPVTRSWALW